MDAHPLEESSPSYKLNERQKIVGNLPSIDLLNTLLEHPRDVADYFSETISQRYPDSVNAELKSEVSQQTDRTIECELNSYTGWLNEHMAITIEEYTSLVTSSEKIPEDSELTFHIINQFIMPQWRRVLVSPKHPKMDTMDLQTAQIQLAIESMAFLPAPNSIEQTGLFDTELRDIGAMIKLLQLCIDCELHNRPNLVVVPHPEMGSKKSQADFVIFEPADNGSFTETAVKSSNIIDPAQKPGLASIELLNNIKIASISHRPEFQSKAQFHKFILAHQKARLFTKE